MDIRTVTIRAVLALASLGMIVAQPPRCACGAAADTEGAGSLGHDWVLGFDRHGRLAVSHDPAD